MGFGRWGTLSFGRSGVSRAVISHQYYYNYRNNKKQNHTHTNTIKLLYSRQLTNTNKQTKLHFFVVVIVQPPFHHTHTHTFKVNKKIIFIIIKHTHTQAIIKWTTIIKQIIITIMRVTSKQTNKKRKKIVAKTMANKQPASKSVCLMFSFSVSSF